MSGVYRVACLILLLCIGAIARANMASPVVQGTPLSTVFSSNDVDIISETIHIKVDKNFESARYEVTYHLLNNQSESQIKIPLAFEVLDDIRSNPDSFFVVFDGKPIVTINNSNRELPSYYDAKTDNYTQFMKNVEYFDIDLTHGNHTLEVSYVATPTINRSDWVKSYVYQYSLQPAKSWKSFGDLTIILDIEDDPKFVTTNIDKPLAFEKTPEHTMTWHFDEIPQDIIEIKLQTEPNFLANLLIELNAWVLFLTAMLLFGYIHYRLMYRSRLIRSNTAGLVTWIGIIIVPLLALVTIPIKIDLIDWLIGTHASRYHGYVLLIVVLGYPLVLPVYLIVMKYIDIRIKRTLA